MIDKNIKDYNIHLNSTHDKNQPQKFDITIDENKNLCVVKIEDDFLIGVSIPYKNIYQNVPVNMILIVVSLIILSIAGVIVILKMINYYIIQGMYRINKDLEKIEAGALDYRVSVTHLPEFKELSNNINQMVGTLLENTVKLSLVFQNVNIPIAVYEYNNDMKRVLATSKVGDILGLSANEAKLALDDQNIFKEKITNICQTATHKEGDVYLIGGTNPRYVKIRSYKEPKKTLGILVDVTEEMEEKQKIKHERDIDLLTGIYTRRTFFENMDKLLTNQQILKTKAMLMIDVDNLKQINDTHGHDYGDKLLQQIASILGKCPAKNKLLARLSGDEFVMFIYNVDSETDLQEYLDAMQKIMRDTFITLPNMDLAPVRFSCGYVVMQPNETDYDAALKIADETMYIAKKNRKGEYIKHIPTTI